MAKETKLLVVLDEKGIHTEVRGKVPDIMLMAEIVLTRVRQTLEEQAPMSHEEAMKLMDAVIENYNTEAKYGPEVAAARAFMEILKNC